MIFADGIDWVALVRDLGIPVVALMALSWAVWRLISWCGTNLVIPIRDRLGMFFTNLEQTLSVQAGILAGQSTCLEALRVLLEQALKQLPPNGPPSK